MRLKDLDTWQMRRSASAEAKKEELRRCFDKSDITLASVANDRGSSFVYIQYWQPRDAEVYWDYTTMRTMIRTVGGKLHKRYFPSYAKAIAQLTKLKLALIDEDEYPWNTYIACAIVEGYRTYKGGEIVEKRTELPNERNSEEGRRLGRRLERERRASDISRRRNRGFSIPEGLGSNSSKTTSTSTVRSGGTVTSSSSTATVGTKWYDTGTVSDPLWRSIVGDYQSPWSTTI